MNNDQANVMFKNMLLAEQAQLNTLKTQHIALLQASQTPQKLPMPGEAQAIASTLRTVCEQRDEAMKALREAQEIVKEWQSAMEAWRDLAQTLRDEIKACPNHEAHTFGKDDKARNQRLDRKEDEARVAKGLKPRFSAERKGI